MSFYVYVFFKNIAFENPLAYIDDVEIKISNPDKKFDGLMKQEVNRMTVIS